MTDDFRARQIAEMLTKAGWAPEADLGDFLPAVYRRWPDVSFVEVNLALELAEESSARLVLERRTLH
jgi:hypothetical protein